MTISKLTQTYIEREAAAKAKKTEGVKVVGYLSNNVPVELLIAAGMFPVLLTGSPDEDTPLADKYMDDCFDGNIRSIFNRILSGHFSYLDLIIIPRTSNAYLYLYYFLQEAQRWQPELKLPEFYLFDLLHTPYWTTGQYNRDRMDDLKVKLENLSGKQISGVALRIAIRSMNTQRQILRDVNVVRRVIPTYLSGTDMLQIIGSWMFTNTVINDTPFTLLLDNLAQSAPRTGARLMVKGSPHDNTTFYELVESLGATIVADDHLMGERVIEDLVEVAMPPLDALTQKYHLHSPSIRSFPQATQDKRFMEQIDAAKVEGVIFFHDEFDDTLGWDYPDQKKLLDGKNIPSVFLKAQSYRTPNVDEQTSAIKDLIARCKK